jgi:hypothetical protein
MENKSMQRTGFFMHSENPSPLMQKVMENIQRQHMAEMEYRQAVRAGRIQPDQFTNWNISDRH